ncbi:MAG TPA: hypothetical protein VD999_04660 [Vitreimonas sp.]|nr:hypothetical protein [Vitreimonas sp.]
MNKDLAPRKNLIPQDQYWGLGSISFLDFLTRLRYPVNLEVNKLEKTKSGTGEFVSKRNGVRSILADADTIHNTIKGKLAHDKAMKEAQLKSKLLVLDEQPPEGEAAEAEIDKRWRSVKAKLLEMIKPLMPNNKQSTHQIEVDGQIHQVQIIPNKELHNVTIRFYAWPKGYKPKELISVSRWSEIDKSAISNAYEVVIVRDPVQKDNWNNELVVQSAAQVDIATSQANSVYFLSTQFANLSKYEHELSTAEKFAFLQNFEHRVENVHSLVTYEHQFSRVVELIRAYSNPKEKSQLVIENDTSKVTIQIKPHLETQGTLCKWSVDINSTSKKDQIEKMITIDLKPAKKGKLMIAQPIILRNGLAQNRQMSSLVPNYQGELNRSDQLKFAQFMAEVFPVVSHSS